jgi:DNA-binding response OmpR family regulator
MKAHKQSILVVDDEEDICDILKFNLESEGYQVETVLSSEKVLQMPLEKYDLFVLDIMMKGMSGLMLADELRRSKMLNTPIIFLSARNSENDKLTGFNVGADDYITKPFSVKEMIARIKAILRRNQIRLQQDSKNAKLVLMGLELDCDKKKLYVDGTKSNLTPNEYRILQLLMRSPGTTFTREQILNHAWKDTSVIDRTVDVHITRLRKKMGKYGKCLISRSGYGYCLEMD